MNLGGSTKNMSASYKAGIPVNTNLVTCSSSALCSLAFHQVALYWMQTQPSLSLGGEPGSGSFSYASVD